ncbi:MAG: c-type cytochrome [Deltaproteobacteria bacterium]|nr:c-type cytochrome [Deltaproteobacteria bacterium]MBP7291667.1 c-type cytochrome [Nannocystaceae bacterium]
MAWLHAACSFDASGQPTADASTGTSGTAHGSSGATAAASDSGSAVDTTAADGSGEGGLPPGPWDDGWPIPAEPQTEGDPEAGWYQLTHEGYVSCGIPLSMWGLLAPFMSNFTGGEPLPDRDGDNANIPYNWNVHVAGSGVKVVSQNCLTCHAGRFDGKLVIGLGDVDTDFTQRIDQLLELVPTPDLPAGDLDELSKFLDRLKVLGPYTTMRTVGTNPAEPMAVTLVAHHDRDTLAWSDEPLQPLPEIIVPSDPPPWWRAHKKNALFYNAMARGDHRGTMMLASSLCTDSVDEATAIAAYFNNIHAFVRSVRAPLYPYPIDAPLAQAGEPVFLAHCAGCHGTYASGAAGHDDSGDTYPNLLLPLDVIGTDPVVAQGGTIYAPQMVEWYNLSFYGTITRMAPDEPFEGYAAPPLDGIWATAPFFHNGSVPNLAAVIDSSKRPTYWKRVDHDTTNFDQPSVGWPYVALDYGQDQADAAERRHIYDTTQFAHGNGGHDFGDALDDAERRALLEYLKTL